MKSWSFVSALAAEIDSSRMVNAVNVVWTILSAAFAIGALLVGLELGDLVGEMVGENDFFGALVLGLEVGDLVGNFKGTLLGERVGTFDRATVLGLKLGALLGDRLGENDLVGLGLELGALLGD